jgi:uncharacterized protein (TIGR03437 family)
MTFSIRFHLRFHSSRFTEIVFAAVLLVVCSSSGFAAQVTTANLPIPVFAGSFPSTIPSAVAMAVDASGYIYLAGNARSNLTGTPGAFQSRPPAKDPAVCPNPRLFDGFCMTPFVAKLDPTGQTILYLTYLSGNLTDYISSIAVDSQGSVYAAGWTQSTNFPTTSGSYKDYSLHSWPAFVVKLNPAGSDIVYGALFGGSGGQGQPVSAVAVDPEGNAYVTGTTNSTDFPITPGAFQSNTSPAAVFGDRGYIVKLNPAGSAPVYSSYIGAAPRALAADRSGQAYVTGESWGQLTTTPGSVQPGFHGESDAFVLKVSAQGTLLYSTYIGGPMIDRGRAIAVDDRGSAYITGVTGQVLYGGSGPFPNTPQFPVTSGALQRAFGGGGGDGFALKLTPDGTGLVYSTYLGGGDFDSGSAIQVNSQGEAVILGSSASYDFPITPDAFLPTIFFGFAGGPIQDSVFLVKLDAAGGKLNYGTHLQSFLVLTMNPQKNIAYVPLLWRDAPQLATIDFRAEPPPLFLSGAGNSASDLGGVVSPGELLSLFGVGFGPETGISATVQNGAIGTTLGGVQVFFDEIAAPVLYAASGQIRVQAPFEITGRQNVQVSVHYAGGQSNLLSLIVFQEVPGIFTTNGNPYRPPAILNQDGSLNTPDNPAARGSIVSIYLTGGGLTEPPSVTGQVTPVASLRFLSAPIRGYIGPKEASVTFAGAAPGLISGANVINLQIPDDAQTGDQIPVSIIFLIHPGGPSGVQPIDPNIAIR